MPSVQLGKTTSTRSTPRVSRIHKIKHRHHHHHPLTSEHRNKYNEHAPSGSVIHRTISIPKIPEKLKDTNLISFSSILSVRQRHQQQDSSKSSSLIQKPSISLDFKTTKNVFLNRHQSTASSRYNNWDNDISNENRKSRKNSISSQSELHREGIHLSLFGGKNLFKSSAKTHIEADQSGVKNEHSTILNEMKRQKKRKNSKKICCCACSIPCALISLLIGLLVFGAIIGIVAGVMTTLKTTTTSTTIITTTIITPTSCSCLCPGESWTFSSNNLGRWSFDGTLDDEMNTYNATSINNPLFVTNGYVNQALYFNATNIQSLSIPYIPLANTSFTIEAWIKPTQFPNLIDHSILGLCPIASSYQCLYLVIRKISSNYYLYFGFYDDDCRSNSSLSTNNWIHVAFVFDIITLKQSIYINGILDNSCIVSAPFMATVGSVTIGTIPALIPITNVNFYQGYIDHVTINREAKSSCEILEDATLAACFLFDTSASFIDLGPNSLLSSELSTSAGSSGISNEAISFNGSSYFQVSSFTGLGIIDKPFSITVWVRPRSVLGTIIHVSSQSNGQSWCAPFLGIAANGSAVAQIWNGGSVSVIGPLIPMSPIWSHLAQTWSPTNGLRLYMNNTLVAFLTSSTTFAASGVSDFVTLANSLDGTGHCTGGALSSSAPGPFNGDMDDFRVYSRELTASDISTIYQSK